MDHPTDTIKAAPCSFSNRGDAFSRFSGLPFFGRSTMICDRGHRNPPHHGASLPRTESLGVCLGKNQSLTHRLGASWRVASGLPACQRVSATPV